MDEAEFDIYDDLDVFEGDEKQQQQHEKSGDYAEICEKLKAAEEEIRRLREENANLKEQIGIQERAEGRLETNSSSLLATARAELKRKDEHIQELRKEKDNVVFRRKDKLLMQREKVFTHSIATQSHITCKPFVTYELFKVESQPPKNPFTSKEKDKGAVVSETKTNHKSNSRENHADKHKYGRKGNEEADIKFEDKGHLSNRDRHQSSRHQEDSKRGRYDSRSSNQRGRNEERRDLRDQLKRRRSRSTSKDRKRARRSRSRSRRRDRKIHDSPDKTSRNQNQQSGRGKFKLEAVDQIVSLPLNENANVQPAKQHHDNESAIQLVSKNVRTEFDNNNSEASTESMSEDGEIKDDIVHDEMPSKPTPAHQKSESKNVIQAKTEPENLTNSSNSNNNNNNSAGITGVNLSKNEETKEKIVEDRVVDNTITSDVKQEENEMKGNIFHQKEPEIKSDSSPTDLIENGPCKGEKLLELKLEPPVVPENLHDKINDKTMSEVPTPLLEENVIVPPAPQHQEHESKIVVQQNESLINNHNSSKNSSSTDLSPTENGQCKEVDQNPEELAELDGGLHNNSNSLNTSSGNKSVKNISTSSKDYMIVDENNETTIYVTRKKKKKKKNPTI